jgi:hypothetical protein
MLRSWGLEPRKGEDLKWRPGFMPVKGRSHMHQVDVVHTQVCYGMSTSSDVAHPLMPIHSCRPLDVVQADLSSTTKRCLR